MAALTNFDFNPNLGGINGFGSEFSNTVYEAKLAATTDTTLTVPSTSGLGRIGNKTPKLLAIFNYQNGATVFVAKGATAAPNAGGAFAANNSVINPTGRIVYAGDVLHFYALAQAEVTVEFQAWQ